MFDAIGTSWTIDIFDPITAEQSAGILEAIQKRIDVFDKNYSRFRPDSLVTTMSQKVGEYPLPDDAFPMLSLYHDLYIRTNGIFTPLIGTMIADAGYDAAYTLTQTKQLETPPTWDEALQYVHPTLTIKQPVIIDVGAAGKGYLIDIIGVLLTASGIAHYTIDAGGDMLHTGATPIRVGLENPDNTDEVIGVYTLTEGSICGSSGNRRAWGNFTHLFNPHTKASPTDIIAVWVAASTALVADALATCLFFVPASSFTGYTFEYLLVKNDHSIERSAHFSDEIFQYYF